MNTLVTIVVLLGIIFVSLCFSMLFTVSIENNSRRVIAIGFLTVLFVVGTIFIMCRYNDYKTKEWNNGACRKCDKQYELIDIIYKKNDGYSYFYQCPDCKEIHIFHENMESKKKNFLTDFENSLTKSK